MRRGFGRPVRGLFGPDVPPLLQRANRMMASGDYAGAASAFEQLARAADARGGPRAPLFHLQAGRAQIMAGRTAAGMEELERGLGLFAKRGQDARAAGAGYRVVTELSQRGLQKEAQQITDYLKGLLPGYSGGDKPSPLSARPPLPTHCPGCGAPLRPDEVEWLDDATAECAFCGSPVRGGR